MPSVLLWFIRLTFYIWGVFAILDFCLIPFTLPFAQGRLFQQYEVITILSGYIRYTVYISGGILAILWVAHSTGRSVKPNNTITSKPIQPKQLVSIIFFIAVLTLLAPFFWEKIYIPFVGEYTSGNEMTINGTVIRLKETRGKPSSQPALDMTFVLDGEGKAYTAHFDSILRAKPWYELNDFRKWRPQVGDRAEFRVKENVFGRSVILVQRITTP